MTTTPRPWRLPSFINRHGAGSVPIQMNIDSTTITITPTRTHTEIGVFCRQRMRPTRRREPL